jgi:hypothetical protein
MNFTKGIYSLLLVCLLALTGGTSYGQAERQSATKERSAVKTSKSTNTSRTSGKTATTAVKPAATNSTEYVYGRTQQSKLSSDVRKHFGNMKYGGVSYLSNSRSNYKALKGQGTVKNKAGKPLKYSYLILTDGKGDIGGFYLGTQNVASTFTVAMTHGEANDRLAECKRTLDPRSGGYARCVNQLAIDILTECLLSSPADCAANCWYNNGICSE